SGGRRKIEGAFEPAGLFVEIGLVDGGAGEAVLDVDVDVQLAQRELRFLPVRIDGDQGTAGASAAGDERRVGSGNQIARPFELRADARRRLRLLAARRQHLTGVQRFLHAFDLDLAANDHDCRVAIADYCQQSGPLRANRSLCRVENEVFVGAGRRGDVDVNVPRIDLQPTSVRDLHARLFVEIKSGAIRQHNAAALAAL